jgi:hypothetical protein
MKKKKKPATPQPLPRVYQAVLALRDEFESFDQAELRRTVQRAVVALEKASAADRRPYRLEQAIIAIVNCHSLCHIRYLDRQIDARRTERALRRIEQILRGLSLLEEAPDEEWTKVTVPRLAPQPLHPHRVQELARLDELNERVSREVRELREREQRPPPPPKPPKLLN